MAHVAIVGPAFVRCVQVSAKDFDYVLSAWTNSDRGASYTLPHEPVASEESSWAPIKRVVDHARFCNTPFGQDGEAATEDAAVIEFAVGKDMASLGADDEVVFLCPAFLQTDDVGLRARKSD